MTPAQTLHPSASASPTGDGHARPLRLRLDPTLCRLGAVDGAWWPYSEDASQELPALVAALDQRLGTAILRVGLHPDTWTGVPSRMPRHGFTVRVAWFRSIDRRMVSLHTARSGSEIELLVIPPETTAAVAETAFALAVQGRGSGTAAGILAIARQGG